jgi:hypothetical protein
MQSILLQDRFSTGIGLASEITDEAEDPTPIIFQENTIEGFSGWLRFMLPLFLQLMALDAIFLAIAV